MRDIIHSLIIIVLTELVLVSCANPKSPTGGVKDTIPPVLLSSNPVNQSVNFQSNTITLEFDEFINADKLKQNLIITPRTEIDYKSFVKKNNLNISLSETLNDSTTYTFNFFEGVTDITEKNPSTNLIIAFSTGSFIDSLSVSGSLFNIPDSSASENLTVGLYNLTDTLSFEKINPTYFLTTDESGAFQINNIKAGLYRLMAFADENNNLLFDPDTEKHGFMTDTLDLNKNSIDSLRIPVSQINVAELKLKSARPSTHYFIVTYTKPITAYNITSNKQPNIYSQLSGENQAIKFYPQTFYNDSTEIFITAFDSLNNSTTDTIFATFRESSKKLDAFNLSLLPKSGSQYPQNQIFSIHFSKPVIPNFDSSFVTINIDTLISFQPPLSNILLSNTNTTIQFQISVDQTQIADSIQSYLAQHPVDSTNVDSLQVIINRRLLSYDEQKVPLSIKNGSFISIEEDTSTVITTTYQFPNVQDFGVVKLNLSNTPKHFIVQLMKEIEVVSEIKNLSECSFNFIPPGSYWIRVIIDENGDGLWTPSNITKSQQAEAAKYFLDKTTLRANWEIELDYSL